MTDGNELNFSELLEKLAGDEPVSIALLYRLSDLSEGELDQWRSCWPTLSAERQRVLVRHLADISEGNFQVDFSPVFAFCLSDDQMAVRLAALDGLWDTDKLSLVRTITEMMENDKEPEVQALAAATLGHYILMAEWEQVPARGAESVVAALLRQYDNPQTPLGVKRAALESLGAASHERVPTIITEAYDSGELGLQVSAIFAMGRSADTRWVSIVLDEMSSPVTEMRLEAARAAGSIGHSDAISELIELTVDEDLEVRLAAVTSLGQIGGDTAVRVLESLAEEEESPELQEAVEEALDESMWFGRELDLSLLNVDVEDE